MRAAELPFFGRSRYVVRNVHGGAHLERFLVAAVVTLLLLRFYLELTGFPQIGGKGFHIAHLLWGGVCMLIALVLLLGFLGGPVRHAAATVGGIGFGLFIDELGKFITTDNNYFFRPAIAVIYIIFVIIFIVFRLLERQRPHTEEGYLVNALNMTADAVLRGFDRGDRDHAIEMLDHAPPSNALGSALRQVLVSATTAAEAAPSRLQLVARSATALYSRLVRARWFGRLIVWGFIAYAVLIGLVLLLVVGIVVRVPLDKAGISLKGDVGFSALSIILILAGAILWAKSRLWGLACFKWSILASILLTQPFLFYSDQFWAVGYLFVDLVLLETLNYMIASEQHRQTPARVASSRSIA